MRNPEYIDRVWTRSKALMGNLTDKHVAGSLGGAAATIAVPDAMRRGWGDVMGSGVMAIASCSYISLTNGHNKYN